MFVPSALAKQSRQGKPLTEYFFDSFTESKELCPVETLRQYQKVTASLRKKSKGDSFLEKEIDISACGYYQTSQTSSTLHNCLLVERGSQIIRF